MPPAPGRGASASTRAQPRSTRRAPVPRALVPAHRRVLEEGTQRVQPVARSLRESAACMLERPDQRTALGEVLARRPPRLRARDGGLALGARVRGQELRSVHGAERGDDVR